jgi:hypothetical protein
MFTPVSAAATMKNGAVRKRSCMVKGWIRRENQLPSPPGTLWVPFSEGEGRVSGRAIRGRRHQRIPKSRTGRIATEPLLSIARINASRLNQ